MPLHVSSTCAHNQEVKIALHSLWYHHTYRWPSLARDTRGCVMQFCASSWLITEIIVYCTFTVIEVISTLFLLKAVAPQLVKKNILACKGIRMFSTVYAKSWTSVHYPELHSPTTRSSRMFLLTTNLRLFSISLQVFQITFPTHSVFTES